MLYICFILAQEERQNQIERQHTYKTYKKTHVLTVLVSI